VGSVLPLLLVGIGAEEVALRAEDVVCHQAFLSPRVAVNGGLSRINARCRPLGAD
jgi:hypothetical protein